MRNTHAFVILVLLSLTAAGCAARYEAPQSTIVVAASAPAAGTSDADFEMAWWRQFNDVVLDRLVEAALASNRDLQAAVARYTAAQELAGAVALLPMPQGGPLAGVSRQHLSSIEARGDLPDRTLAVVQTGMGVAWEADLFGRLRGLRRAAAADAGVAAMDVRGVQVAVAAQVAAAYFEFRGAEHDVQLIESLQDRTRQQLERTHALVSAGRMTRLDLFRAQQVEEELAAARSVALHRAERAQNRLATLTGRTPDRIDVRPAAAASLSATVLPIGTAADLLRRRPDVAAAELRLAAASARAHVSRASLFPRVDLTGSVGLIAGSVGRLAEAASASWLVAPRLVWNAFEWPRLRREMRAAGALADAAFADYEQAILQAMEEVRTALDRYAATNREFAAHQRRAQAAEDASSVVFVQYREGLVDSLARTQAERDAIAGALDANRALTAQRLAVVDVYRALGGGWR